MSILKLDKGFTLVELMITIAIMGVMAATFVADTFHNQDARLRKSAEEMVHYLKYIQMCSMYQTSAVESAYKLYAKPDAELYRIYEFGKKGSKVVDLEPGVKIKSMTFMDSRGYPQYDIYFTHEGRPSFAGSFVLANNKGTTAKITVLPVTGRIELVEIV